MLTFQQYGDCLESEIEIPIQQVSMNIRYLRAGDKSEIRYADVVPAAVLLYRKGVLS